VLHLSEGIHNFTTGQHRENAMQEFIAKYRNEMQGTLTGFDRLVFGGTLRRLDVCQYLSDMKALRATLTQAQTSSLFSPAKCTAPPAFKKTRISSRLITALLFTLMVNPQHDRSPLQAHFVCETAPPSRLILHEIRLLLIFRTDLRYKSCWRPFRNRPAPEPGRYYESHSDFRAAAF